MARKSLQDLLDDMRDSVEAAAIFEAIAEQAGALEVRNWWTTGAGIEGPLQREFQRDAAKLKKLANALSQKYHYRSVKASDCVLDRVSIA